MILDQTVATGKGNLLNELSGNKIPRITRDDILPEANRVSMASSEANETAGGGCKEILILHIYKVFYIYHISLSKDSSQNDDSYFL